MDFGQMTSDELYELEEKLVAQLQKDSAPGMDAAYNFTKAMLWKLRDFLYEEEPEEHHERVDRLMGA